MCLSNFFQVSKTQISKFVPPPQTYKLKSQLLVSHITIPKYIRGQNLTPEAAKCF